MNAFDIQFHAKLRTYLETQIADGGVSLWDTPQADFATYRAEAARIAALHAVLKECDEIRKELIGEDRKGE